MTTPKQPTSSAIVFKDLSYRYPDGTRALTEINLTIERGEHIALVGHNGAGKSTLLKQLNGVLLPTSGTVSVLGVEVNHHTLNQVRQLVGLVFQDPDDQLFSPTVKDDVAFGPRNQGLNKEEIARRVKEALELVGLTDRADRPTHHLSFGEKKRAATASVVSMRPQVWAFDEPSSNLDPSSRRLLENFISEIPETVAIVTQDLFFAARTCKRLIVMSSGQIVADGPTREILRQDRMLEEHDLDLRSRCELCRELYGEDC